MEASFAAYVIQRNLDTQEVTLYPSIKATDENDDARANKVHVSIITHFRQTFYGIPFQ